MFDQSTSDKGSPTASEDRRWDYGSCGDGEHPSDTLDRRLSQAAALSSIICGNGLQSFLEHNDVIKDDVLWLLSDTICEAIAARAAERKGARS